MVAPRPMSFTEWKASGYQTTGQLPPDAQMTPVAPPPQYSGDYVPVSSFTPNAVQEGQYYAPAYYPETAVTPQEPQGGYVMPTSFGMGGLTQEQRNNAIASVAPPTSFGYGPNPEAYIARDQGEQYLNTLATDAERARQVAAIGTVTPTSDAYVEERTATNLAERAKQNERPLQEKIIPGEVRNSGVANAAGSAKDALGSGKDMLGSVGIIGAIGQGLGAGKDALGSSGLFGAAATGLETGAGAAMQAMQIPSQRLQEVQITRRYDEITQGNPDATFGPWLPSTMLGSTLVNTARGLAESATEGDRPGDYEALQNWINDPANADLLVGLFENGYGGESGYGAVYKYYNEQQGLGGIVADVFGDPFTYASAGLGSGKSLATRLATKGGRLGTAGRALGTGLEVADALVFDPFKLPGLGVKGLDTVAPALRVGERVDATGAKIGDALFTQKGRDARALKQAEGDAALLTSAIDASAPTDPWLFERDAAGRVRAQTVPGGGVVPLVRDRATGAIRPVQAGDVEEAMRIAQRLPHERDLRLAGTPTTLERHLADWMTLANNPRITGLPREVDFLFPSRGPAYEIGARYTAQRILRHGQEAIDGLYTQAQERFAEGLRDRQALRRIPAAARPANYPDLVRDANRKISQAAHAVDRIDASMEIAGRTDAKAKLRKADLSRIRSEAAKTHLYTKSNRKAARIASGARRPAGATPVRLGYDDVVDVLDTQTRTFAEQRLTSGQRVGDLVLGVRQDLGRLHDLATQATTGPLSAWDAQEFEALLTRYRHLLPNADAALANLDATTTQIAGWKPEQLGALTASEARRQVGIDQGMLTPQGNAKVYGLSARDDAIGAIARKLSDASSNYVKLQLYNPLNILKYSGMQLAGNGVTIALTDFGALPDYAKAIGSRLWNRGRSDALTPADQLMRDAGIGHSPFVKEGVKDALLREGKAGVREGTGLLATSRKIAGGADISLREAAYMHRFQPRYRALQMQMRREAERITRTFGINVTPAQLDNAFAGLDTIRPKTRAWNPTELREALLTASGRPGDPNVQAWADRLANSYANGTRKLHQDAVKNVNRLGFTFDETKADAIFGKVFMYLYWSSRANMLYTREMLGNPALLNGYVSMWRTLDREAEKDGTPDWLRGMYQFMQTPAGLTVFGNPTALLNTFAIFNPEILGSDYTDPNLTVLGQARKRSPFFINPIVDQLLLSAGVYGAGAQSVSLNPVSTTKLYDLINWVNLNSDTPFFTDKGWLQDGNPIPLPIAMRSGGGRALSSWLAEEISPRTKGLLDRLSIPADLMQFGDEAASQRQDIVYQMMDVLREQNPGMDDAALMDLLVEDHGGGFDTADPVYQAALDRYSQRAFAGILEGRDVPNAVRGLIDFVQPFQRLPQTTARLENGAVIDDYFRATDDMETRQNILDGTYPDPIRIGGYEVAPPSLFTTVELGGTVYTAEDLQALTPEEREIVANAWFNARNPRYANAPAGVDLEYPEEAQRLANIAKAASPADLELQEAKDRLYNPGTPEQNEAAGFATRIRNAELEDSESITVTIDGQPRTFNQQDLTRMTEQERRALSGLWIAESGNRENVDAYYAARDALIAEEPDLGGHLAMSDIANAYPGGAVEWVRQAVRDNPETYAQYAARLDPNRYPEGTPDWTKEMLSLEAYQVLTQQRPSSTSPLAWGDASHPPVVPGLGNAGTLSQWYTTDQAAQAAERGETPDQIVSADLVRVNDMLLAADAYDAAQGYAPGTSRGKIIDQIVQGEYNDTNKIDKALLDQLKADYPSVGKDGEEYGPIPTGESFTRRYIVWALGQPEDQRDPGLWSAQDWLTDAFQESAERGLVENAAGQMELAPEVTPDAPPIDFLNGLGLARGADGSGQYLTSSPAQSTGVAQQPMYSVGGIGGTLYQDASTNSQPIIILNPNTPLQTVEQVGDWVHVTEPGGLEGWMRKGYLSSAAQAPAPASEPVATTPAPGTVAPVPSQPLPVPPSQRPGGIAGMTPAPVVTPETSEEDMTAIFQQATPTATPEAQIAPVGSKPGSKVTTNVTGQQIADLADDFAGVPYVHEFPTAADDPYTTGWDCSSFVHWVADSLGISEVQYPNGPGYVGGGVPVGVHFQYEWATKNNKIVSTDWQDAQPGDVIFFNTDPYRERCNPENWNGCMNNDASHIGIYLGADETGRPRMIHSAAPGIGTVFEYLDTYTTIYPVLGVGRLF